MGALPADRPTANPTRVRVGVLVFVCTLSLLTYLDRVCISQGQRDIQFELRISDEMMGDVLGVFSIGYMLFQVPIGWMGDRRGTRRVLTVVVLFWSLFTALTGAADFLVGWTPGFDLATDATAVLIALLAIRFLFGGAEAGAYPNITRVINTWFPFRERATAQGAVWMSARLGGAVAFVTLGALTAWLGWRQAFLILGLAGAAWCLAFYGWFRNTPGEAAACNEAERELIRDGAPPAERVQAWPPLRPMATSMTLWALCVAAFGVNAGWWFFPTYQPRYLEEVHHSGGGAQGAAAKAAAMGQLGSALAPPSRSFSFVAVVFPGLPFLFGAAGALLGGRLSDWLVRRLGNRRWGRSLVGIVGFGGAGLCVLATGFAADVYQAYALLCLASFVNDMAIPVIWQASADVSGRYVGTVSGIMNAFGASAAFLTPHLTPRVLAALPASLSATERWRILFAAYGGCWFMAAAAWIFVNAGKPIFPAPVHGPKAGGPVS